MTNATLTLKDILDSGEYEVMRGVPIFDAHDEFDADGNLIRRFGREELQEICDNTNARNDDGDLTILGLGHTIPRDPVTREVVPESKQPKGIGYVANYKVGTFGPKDKTGILVDLLVHKNCLAEIKDPATDRITYERRSIELRPKEKIIDWVALLRKAPARDLGLLTYSRDTFIAHTPTRKFYPTPTIGEPLAMAVRGEKLFYSVEDSDMPMDPTAPADAAAPDDDFAGKIDRYMAEKYPHLDRIHGEAVQRYEAEQAAAGAPEGSDPPAAGPGTPGASNSFIPGDKKKPDEGDDKEKLRMEKETEAIRYSRLEKEVETLRAEREKDKADAKRAKAAQRIQAHVYAGFTLDASREVARYCALDEATWDAEDEHIRRYYKQDGAGMVPVGGFIDTYVPGPVGGSDITPDQQRAITRFATKNGMSFSDAKEKVLAGK